MSAPAMGTTKTAHSDVAPKKKRGPGALATAYLVIYNVVMTAGWLVIAVGLVRAYLARGSYHGLYYSIEKPLKFFQTGALLEVLHCAVGIVPSSVVLTGFQVLSRVFLTWAVTHSVRELSSSQRKSFAETLRSRMKTVSCSLCQPGPSQRSSVTPSTLSVCSTTCPTSSNGHALPYVQKTGLYSVTLPNKYNFSFDYHTFLILTMVSYIPLFPQLYFHMMRQRKKVLCHVEEYKTE
uniref:Very-long-chain (3R)-3-hydroxyacyl-CoA dehydratase n=1 Tax=Oncorhynchus tshawytscha TaxID=74940 RepID=A0A8C8JMC9_ONCTS